MTEQFQWNGGDWRHALAPEVTANEVVFIFFFNETHLSMYECWETDKGGEWEREGEI